jgi:hypothetical protein
LFWYSVVWRYSNNRALYIISFCLLFLVSSFMILSIRIHFLTDLENFISAGRIFIASYTTHATLEMSLSYNILVASHF